MDGTPVAARFKVSLLWHLFKSVAAVLTFFRTTSWPHFEKLILLKILGEKQYRQSNFLQFVFQIADL